MRGLGYLPDAPDPRDWSASRLLGAAPAPPERASIRDLAGPALDQGRIGSCVAHAVASAIRASHRLQGVVEPALASRLALYWLSRATHGAEDYDSGTYLRSAFRVATRLGFCPERAWPYDVAKFAVQPPFRAFRASHDQASGARYWRISSTGGQRELDVRRALAAQHPVVFGSEVGQPFVEGSFDARRPYDPARGSIAGGHAMLVGGYGPGGYDVLSSWGTGWGDDGWFVASRDYVAERVRDVWVVERAPLYSDS